MSESAQPVLASVATPAQRPKKKYILGKVVLVATGVLFAMVFYQCGTGMVRAAKSSDTAVAEFHKKLNAEQYDAILAEADKRFQESGPKPELLDFFGAVHRKLGNAVSAKRGGIATNTNMSGTFATVEYETTFENGPAHESFTWTIDGSKMSLLRYNIQSNLLITK